MSKKESALVFTSLSKTWFKNNRNILVGEWCLKQINETKHKNFKYKVSDREDRINVTKDAKICDYYYEKLLIDVTKKFENLYKFNWNKRSWEVFLGPWTHRFVAIAYDRFKATEHALKKFKINKVILSSDHKFGLLTQDINEFKSKALTDEWNLLLFSKIFLRCFHKDKIKVLKTRINSKVYQNENRNLKKINFFKIFICKILRFTFSFFDKYTKNIFYRTYFNNRKFIFDLNILKKNIPIIYDFNYQIPNVDFISKIRSQKIKSNFKLNLFEKLLRELFFELLPFYYLEKIDFLKNSSSNLFLPSTKKRNIYTGVGLWHDDIFKFWLSKSLSNGSKLFNFQHGCNYGVTKYSYAENLELKLCDFFFTWGWKSKSKKVKRFNSTRLSNIKKNINSNSKKLLIVTAAPQTYRIENTTGNLTTKRSFLYYSMIKKFIKTFLISHKDLISLRPFPSEKKLFCNLSTELRKEFKELKIENTNKSLIDTIKNFGAIIHTYDSTSFLETMSLNKPSFLIFSDDIYKNNNRKSSKHYYNLLRKAKILHPSHLSLIKFLEKIEFNFDKWWNKNLTQTVRKTFCHQYCNVVNNPLIEFKKI